MSPARMYVGGLPRDIREKDLERFFEKYGRITDIIIKTRFAFVEFDDARDADDAIYELDGRRLLGSKVSVELAKGKPRDSRRDRHDESRRGFNGRDRGRNNERRGPPQRTKHGLIVENLSSKTTWPDLKRYMGKAGEVSYAEVHQHRRNEGLVEYVSLSDMEKALESLDGSEFEGRRLRLTKRRSGRRIVTRSFSSSPSRKRSRRSGSRSSCSSSKSRKDSALRSERSSKKRRVVSRSSSRSKDSEHRSRSRSVSRPRRDSRKRSESLEKKSRSRRDSSEPSTSKNKKSRSRRDSSEPSTTKNKKSRSRRDSSEPSTSKNKKSLPRRDSSEPSTSKNKKSLPRRDSRKRSTSLDNKSKSRKDSRKRSASADKKSRSRSICPIDSSGRAASLENKSHKRSRSPKDENSSID